MPERSIVIVHTILLFARSCAMHTIARNACKIEYTVFITSVLSSLAVLILALIPATRPLVAFVTTNPLICIGFSVLGIIIATLFLLCDFETIRQVVENKLPKKYEWSAAFGLAFTVIWLYFKILDLLAKLTNTKSS